MDIITRQGSLFNDYANDPIIKPAQAKPSISSLGEALPALLELWPTIEQWHLDQAEVDTRIPQNLVIPYLAALSTRVGAERFKTTDRKSPDAERIRIPAWIAVSKFLGETPEAYFSKFKRSIEPRFDGVVFGNDRTRVGLRSTGTTSRCFGLPNPKTNRRSSVAATAYVFCEVRRQHDGDTFVKILGACDLSNVRRYADFNRNTVIAFRLRREGVLLAPYELKALLEGGSDV